MSNFLYKFTGLNILFIVLFIAAVIQGWVGMIWEGDISHIVFGISLVFLFGLIISIQKALQLHNHKWTFDIKDNSFESKDTFLQANIQIIQHISSVLLLMGICGTIVGIILALKSTEHISIGDSSNMLSAIVLLFKGIYVKFYTSLVGICAHIWTSCNYHMLDVESQLILSGTDEKK